jgi:type I restriction-modification system DNA methylase subunit
MPAPEIIHRLVTQFEENRDLFHKGKINEAQLRLEFLDPFLEAIGWDVYNKNGYSPDYREVVTEDSLDIEGASKAPDYSFRIGRERKFFVEAKKPAVHIEYDIHPAYQVRRYAWNAHLPLSILTDFEEFAVYDCRNRPNPTDKASTDRTMFLTYKDYIDKWDEIVAIFSPNAIQKGSFDKYAIENKGKKGTTEVDDAFLEDIENWRKLLALNIALRNPQVSDERELNFAVQITIDRIIFLRICEDRGIEPEEQLLNATQKPGIYAELMRIFQNADRKYNSGLFHFKTEAKGDIGVDMITPTLKIDDKTLKEIIKSIYYPCPYIFKEIPVEILGQVYEQFLGKVIRLTPGHQAKVEDKPEVRKAGGVYYTPKYIVDYIVENTVGKLLVGKVPNEVTSLKIVDPACGSGSFLLGAFQCLMDWHENWYIQDGVEKWAKGKNPTLVATSSGGWKLTTSEKKKILLNNLHGVDIDAQAVEVTKLSLLLKVLEEESGQLSLGLERALPDLSKNIQCGNSLIGEDYFEGRLLVDEEERRQVNPFEWNLAFPRVFAHGGFDVVIGNPPYLKIEHISEDERVYFGKSYKSYFKRFDTFGLFVEKSHDIIRNIGLSGMIIPSTILNNLSFKDLRKLLILETSINMIVNLGGKIFQGVNNDTLILIFDNQKIKDKKTKIFDVVDYGKGINTAILVDEKNLALTSVFPSFVFELRVSKDAGLIINKIQTGRQLSDYYSSFQGFVTGGNDAYIFTDKQIANKKIETELLKPAIFGGEIGRYAKPKPQTHIAYITKTMNLENYPKFKAHIEKYKSQLISKREVRLGRQPWFALHWPREEKNFNRVPKILVQAIRNLSLQRRVIATLDDQGLFADHTLFVLFPKNNDYNIFYILGILNSTLINFLFSKKYIDINIKGIYLSDIPIPVLDSTNDENNQISKLLITYVKRILELNKKTPHTPQEKESMKREIAATDRQIDFLVYELYGLNEEEIKIVEGG